MLCKASSSSSHPGSVFSSSVLADGQPMGGVCRACMHSFFIDCQSLRELRITSVLRNVAIQKKEMWVGSNVTGPCEFFLREEVFQATHAFSRLAPPPSSFAPLLDNPPPPLKSSVVPEAGSSPASRLRQGRSLYRRVAHQI